MKKSFTLKSFFLSFLGLFCIGMNLASFADREMSVNVQNEDQLQWRLFLTQDHCVTNAEDSGWTSTGKIIQRYGMTDKQLSIVHRSRPSGWIFHQTCPTGGQSSYQVLLQRESVTEGLIGLPPIIIKTASENAPMACTPHVERTVAAVFGYTKLSIDCQFCTSTRCILTISSQIVGK